MVELIHVRSKNHGVELTPLNICWIEGERAIFTRKKVRRGRGGALSSLNRACIAMLHYNRNRLVPSLVEFPCNIYALDKPSFSLMRREGFGIFRTQQPMSAGRVFSGSI